MIETTEIIAMRTILLILVALLILPLAGCTSKQGEASGGDIYTCPMHPSVQSDKPGACPVCGMALVRKSSLRQDSTPARPAGESITLTPDQAVLARVQVMEVRREHFEHGLNAVGVIDYAEPAQAKVTARFRGRISRLFVSSSGAVVKKGQPLFDLYSPDLAIAENEFVIALPQGEEATGRDGLAATARQRLEIHYGLTEEQVNELARTRKASSTVTFYSPIHGTVVSKNIQEGQYVDEGVLLYQLADLSTVWANLDIYESDIPAFAVGQSIRINTEAYAGRVFDGKISFISPTVEPETRTVRVRVDLDNRAGLLKPGMYVHASALMNMGQSIVVPRSALLLTGKRTVVWIRTGENQFEPRDVRPGMSDDQRIEILSGLAVGDSVVVHGGFLLDSESALQSPASVDVNKNGAPAPTHPPSPAPVPALHNHEGHAGMSMTDTRAARSVSIEVTGEYTPDVVPAAPGEKLKLVFTRTRDVRCTREVVFPTLGISKELPVGKPVAIEVTAPASGDLPFQCGMEMVTGAVTVGKKGGS
jgi:membrane fusion protein, copper/silver efflux system